MTNETAGAALQAIRRAGQPFDVSFMMVPDYSIMSFSAAVEPLRAANRLSGSQLYNWHVVAEARGPVQASCGLGIGEAIDITEAPRSDLTLVVAGYDAESFARPWVLEWLRRIRARGGIVGGISNGPLILARAGLLSGRKAANHWEARSYFEAFHPDVELIDALYCLEGDVVTAAGGTAALDLMLAIIAERQGRQLAADVAEQFLHGPLRPSNAGQRQDVGWRYRLTNPRMVRAIRLMEDNVDPPLKVGDIARHVGVSGRQLERLFEAHLARRPSEFYLDLRLKLASNLLINSACGLDEIAERCGFASTSHFSRAFKKRIGIAPSHYRRARRFQSAGAVDTVIGGER